MNGDCSKEWDHNMNGCLISTEGKWKGPSSTRAPFISGVTDLRAHVLRLYSEHMSGVSSVMTLILPTAKRGEERLAPFNNLPEFLLSTRIPERTRSCNCLGCHIGSSVLSPLPSR